MDELNNLELLSRDETTDSSTPAITMLTTMLLLTAGFILSSIMLGHYMMTPRTENKNIHAAITLLTKTFSTEKAEKETETSNLNALFSERDLMTHWPRLKLAGFGKSEDESSNFAIINGKKVHPGQSIAGKVTLVEIRDHDVMVEFKGETRILTIEN